MEAASVIDPLVIDDGFTKRRVWNQIVEHRKKVNRTLVELDSCPRMAEVTMALVRAYNNFLADSVSCITWTALFFDHPKVGKVKVGHNYNRIHWRGNTDVPVMVEEGKPDTVICVEVKRRGESEFAVPARPRLDPFAVLETLKELIIETCGLEFGQCPKVFTFCLDFLEEMILQRGYLVISDKIMIGEEVSYQVKVWDGSNLAKIIFPISEVRDAWAGSQERMQAYLDSKRNRK
jgi:hypothetical protein